MHSWYCAFSWTNRFVTSLKLQTRIQNILILNNNYITLSIIDTLNEMTKIPACNVGQSSIRDVKGVSLTFQSSAGTDILFRSQGKSLMEKLAQSLRDLFSRELFLINKIHNKKSLKLILISVWNSFLLMEILKRYVQR